MLLQPTNIFSNLHHWIGDDFSAEQLLPNGDTAILPADETWKKESAEDINGARIDGWRSEMSQKGIRRCTLRRCGFLHSLGYDTSDVRVSFSESEKAKLYHSDLFGHFSVAVPSLAQFAQFKFARR